MAKKSGSNHLIGDTKKSPRYLRIYDAGDTVGDRYTVVFTKLGKRANYPYMGMSANPTHPQGIGYHGDAGARGDGYPDSSSYAHLGKKITYRDLPEAVQRVVIENYAEYWGIDYQLLMIGVGL